jgi:hypothetical protein
MINAVRCGLALALIIGASLVHGAWTSRWRLDPALSEQAARLGSVAPVVGEWTGTPFAVDAREMAAAGAVGHLARYYTHSSTGVTLTVLLISGYPAEISSHTPDVCYPGAGYVLEAPAPFTRNFGDPAIRADFRTALATRGGVAPSVLRIFWSWNDGKAWSAPEESRWTFASAPTLCKLYVIRETLGDATEPKDDPTLGFLDVFLPELNRAIFSTTVQPANTKD